MKFTTSTSARTGKYHVFNVCQKIYPQIFSSEQDFILNRVHAEYIKSFIGGYFVHSGCCSICTSKYYIIFCSSINTLYTLHRVEQRFAEIYIYIPETWRRLKNLGNSLARLSFKNYSWNKRLLKF